MKNLQEILNLYFKPSHQGNLTVEKVFTDTRKPQKNGLFIALKGENFDGHDFILKAAEGEPPPSSQSQGGFRPTSARCNGL